jgi:ribosome-binding protein aMBF1 (putative translation factor)
MAEIKLTPLADVVDEVWGKEGTPHRDAMEMELKKDVNTFFLGDAIRKARQTQNLTQDELGARIGVQRAQICRLESGKSAVTLSTVSRVFKALGVPSATLDLEGVGKIALW